MDEFRSSMQKVGKSMDNLDKQVNRMATAFAGLWATRQMLNYGRQALELYDNQVKAETALLVALKGREDVQQRLIQQAGELQNASRFGDEAIIQAQSFLASMQLNEEQIKQTTVAAVNLSAATGMDLMSSTKNLAKTFGGLTGELGELIPQVKTLTKEQLIAGGAIDYVSTAFAGQAEAAASVGMGALVQLENMWGDFLEGLGKVSAWLLGPFVKAAKKMVAWIQNMSSTGKILVVAIGSFLAIIPAVIAGIVAITAAMSALSTASLPVAGIVLGIIAALGILAAAGAYVYDNWEAFGDRFARLWVIIKNAAIEAVALILDALDMLNSWAGIEIFGKAADKIREFKSEIPDSKDATEFKSFGDSIKNVATEIFGSFEDVTAGIRNMAAASASLRGKEEPIKLQRKAIGNLGLSYKATTENLMAYEQTLTSTNDELVKMYLAIQKTADNTSRADALIGSFGSALSDSFNAALISGESFFQTLGNWFKNMLAQIAAAIAAAAILAGLFQVMGFGSAKGFGEILGQLLGGGSGGGILKGLGIKLFAEGGVVNRPTLGVFGEAGPEAVMPLGVLNGMLQQASGVNLPDAITLRANGYDLVSVVELNQQRNKRTF